MTTNQRQKHHINSAIQNRLIISFVIVELALISIAIFILYLDMNQLIEDNMFRSHIQNTLNIEFFAIRLLQASAILLAINLVAASFIVWYWRSYVSSITRPLDDIIGSIERLDFSLNVAAENKHEALLLAENWLRTEKIRFTKIRNLLSDMDIDIDHPSHITEQLNLSRQLIKE